jgi:hypothetical protein
MKTLTKDDAKRLDKVELILKQLLDDYAQLLKEQHEFQEKMGELADCARSILKGRAPSNGQNSRMTGQFPPFVVL